MDAPEIPAQTGMRTSPETDKLWLAMFNARPDLRGVEPDATNTHLRSRYATIKAVYRAVDKALHKHGLLVVQTPMPSPQANVLRLETRVIHVASGQWVESELWMPHKADAHGLGGGLTYARRYALRTMLGVWDGEDDDDDGEAAMGRAPQQKAKGGSKSRLGSGADEVSAKVKDAAKRMEAAKTMEDLEAIGGELAGVEGADKAHAAKAYSAALSRLTAAESPDGWGDAPAST